MSFHTELQTLKGDLRKVMLFLWALSALGSLLVISLLAWGAPHWLAWLPPCKAAAQGLSCAFCGMTRAFWALSQGQWELAFQLHPWSGFLFLILLLNPLLWGLWIGIKFKSSTRFK